jgi:hypothetical protein
MTGFLAKRFDPRGQIDGRADDREVEPRLAADIAVKHVANMQGDAARDGR